MTAPGGDTPNSHDDGPRVMKHIDDITLSLLREGDLDEVRAAEVRAHLDACGECRARAEALERMLARLTDPPEEEIPPLLAGRLDETYGAPKGEAQRAAWLRFAPALVGVAAAVAVATIAVRAYAPGVLGGGGPAGGLAGSPPAGAPPAAEKAAAPTSEPATEPAPGAEDTAGAVGDTLDGGGARVLAADAPTSALTAYAGPALPVPLFDMPSVTVDPAYLRAIVSQPGIVAYARRHAEGAAQVWQFRYGEPFDVQHRAPGPLVHEALGRATANDRELVLAAVREGVSGVDAREAMDAARKAWPGMQSGPAGWESEAPIVWMAVGNWEPTGEQVWVVVGIDVFSPIEGAFRVQAVALDTSGNELARAGSGAQTAAPLR